MWLLPGISVPIRVTKTQLYSRVKFLASAQPTNRITGRLLISIVDTWDYDSGLGSSSEYFCFS